MPDLDDFLGDWRMARTIDDARTPSDGRFDGTARFAADGAGLLYREDGLLRLGGGPAMVASRQHLWGRDGRGVAVRFADGRPFHRFDPSAASVDADHVCGADHYRVAYDFSAWPAWSSDWTVTGPAKAYRMRTAYARA